MPQALNSSPQEERNLFCRHARPLASSTGSERKKAVLGIVVTALPVASVHGWPEGWPLLPFAGLEIGMLAWAFDAPGRRTCDVESLQICGGEILIERREGAHPARRARYCPRARRAPA